MCIYVFVHDYQTTYSIQTASNEIIINKRTVFYMLPYYMLKYVTCFILYFANCLHYTVAVHTVHIVHTAMNSYYHAFKLQ